MYLYININSVRILEFEMNTKEKSNKKIVKHILVLVKVTSMIILYLYRMYVLCSVKLILAGLATD